MNRAYLPVRPAPIATETLVSYVDRLATANHISRAELMGGDYPRAGFRYGHDEVLTIVHQVTGIPCEVLRRMAHPVAASKQKGLLGIRTRNQVICHHCHGQDGIRMLEWDHPLVTVCFYCNGILTPVEEGPAPR